MTSKITHRFIKYILEGNYIHQHKRIKVIFDDCEIYWIIKHIENGSTIS